MTPIAAARRSLRPLKKAIRDWTESPQGLARALRGFNVTTSARINGKRFEIPVRGGLGLKNREVGEAWMIDLLERLLRVTASAGLIDVGVNIGQTLLKLKSINENLRWIGFEPNPTCVGLVHELIRLNDFTDCHLFPVALSDRAGALPLIASSEADDCASVVPELRPDRRAFREQFIAALVFDELPLPVRNIRLVKVDVEGAERQVLEGMRQFLQRERPIVVCEVLHAHSVDTLESCGRQNRAMVDLFQALDFRIFWLKKDGARIGGLEPVAAFPDVVWTDQSWGACDYAIVPGEQTSRLLAEFTGAARP